MSAVVPSRGSPRVILYSRGLLAPGLALKTPMVRARRAGGIMIFRQKRTIDSMRLAIPRDELRRRSRLLVIDDERPDLVDDLQRGGFAVDYQQDITRQNLNMMDQPLWDLILLDFGNVGTTIGPDQGLTLLRHIKRINPAAIILAYTSKALLADQADFYRLADGVLAKDAGIADSMEKIEESLQKSHSVENTWRALLNLGRITPGSEKDKEWQDLAVRAMEQPKRLAAFKDSVLKVVTNESAQKIGMLLIQKLIECGVKAAMEGKP
jgi:DNA-binding NarL/FixJ family response regulator